MRQFKDLVQFIKGFLNNQNKRKVVENALIIIIIGVIAIIAGGSLFKKDTPRVDKPEVETDRSSEVPAGVIHPENKTDLEKRMEAFLSKVKGAGRVDVMITFVSGKELVPAYDIKENENDTQEKDSGGGTRSTKQNDSENKVVYKETGGNKEPVILKELQPRVEGVGVTADGAADPVVRESLCSAVQALVNVEAHKITILERESE